MMEEHGWRNGHEKRLNENYGPDKTVSLVSRVVNFAHVAAQRCAENCRDATDSEDYRV